MHWHLKVSYFVLLTPDSLHCYVFVYIVIVNFISWSLDCFHEVTSI